MDLGLSKRHRSVGLIQLHQTLDPRAESMQHIVTQLRHMETEDHKPTRGEPRIKRCRSRREWTRNEPDRFRCLYKREPTGPIHSSFSLLSLQRFRERSSATSLFFSVVFSDEHHDGGTVAAGGAAVPEPFSKTFHVVVFVLDSSSWFWHLFLEMSLRFEQI